MQKAFRAFTIHWTVLCYTSKAVLHRMFQKRYPSWKKSLLLSSKSYSVPLSTSKLGRKILISLQYKEISLDQLQETASVSRGSAAAFKGPCVWQKVVFDFSFLKGFTWGRQQLFLPWVVGYFLGLEAEVGWCGLECQAALLSTHASEVCNLSP